MYTEIIGNFIANFSWVDDATDWLNDNYDAIIWGCFFGSIFLMVSVQMLFTSKIKRYSAITSNSGKTGAQIAMSILDKNGISNVQIVKGKRTLGDNFNPTNNTITLSPGVYDSTSVAAVAIAAHEVGHAIQWSNNWIGIKIRNIFLIPAQIGSQLGWTSFMIGMFASLFSYSVSDFSFYLMFIGVVLIVAIALFQLVTLPVEFDASRRALKELSATGALDKKSSEYSGSKSVLTAAAMTYVVGLITTLLTLFRLIAYLAAANSRRR